jgi:hypothetical protein
MVILINAKFAAMKSQKKLLFKMILFLALFFCPVINAHSNFALQLNIEEHSTCTSNEENSFSSHINPVNEDQIDQSYNFGLPEESIFQILPPRNCFLIFNFCLPVWQPPKIF